MRFRTTRPLRGGTRKKKVLIGNNRQQSGQQTAKRPREAHPKKKPANSKIQAKRAKKRKKKERKKGQEGEREEFSQRKRGGREVILGSLLLNTHWTGG